MIRRPLEPSAIGDPYDGSFLDGRPNEPIFPVGAVDARLTPHTLVIGVRSGATSVAFPVERAREALEAGAAVRLDGVAAELRDGGLVLVDADGTVLLAQEGFWFAWQQREPATSLWTP